MKKAFYIGTARCLALARTAATVLALTAAGFAAGERETAAGGLFKGTAVAGNVAGAGVGAS